MEHNKQLSSDELNLELARFTGTETWYRHCLIKALLYTEGAQYFFQTTESYWLLDVIATEYYPLLECEPFLFIKVESESNKAKIVVTDGNDKVLKSKEIPFTTLIPGIWLFYLTDNVLLLPSEY